MIFLQVPKILNKDNYFICNSLPWGFLEGLLRAFPKWKPNKSGNVFGETLIFFIQLLPHGFPEIFCRWNVARLPLIFLQ